MNFKLYIFGESSGYKQYPDDSVDFKCYYRDQQSNSLLTIKRDADLVYYIYTRKIDKARPSYLGFCLIFNGVYIKKVDTVFSIFEKGYSDCILGGKLFKIGKNGKIGFATDDFASQPKEIDRITDAFNDELERKSHNQFVILPKTYKVGQGNKTYAFTDDNIIIGNAISYYDSVQIPYNGKNDDNLDYIGQMFQHLYAENKALKTNYVKLNRQKKQYRWVAFLSLAVIASLVGLYFLNNNLSGIISSQGATIDKLQKTLADRNDHIVLLQDTIADARKIISQKKEELSNLRLSLDLYKDSLSEAQSNLNLVKNDFPIRISSIDIANSYRRGDIETGYGSTIYSSNTMYLKPRINYTGIDTGRNISLKVKWYMPNGSLSTGDSSPAGYSQQELMTVYSGYNTEVLRGWGNENKGHWGKGTYRIEIWYENVCLKAKTFTIY